MNLSDAPRNDLVASLERAMQQAAGIPSDSAWEFSLFSSCQETAEYPSNWGLWLETLQQSPPESRTGWYAVPLGPARAVCEGAGEGSGEGHKWLEKLRTTPVEDLLVQLPAPDTQSPSPQSPSGHSPSASSHARDSAALDYALRSSRVFFCGGIWWWMVECDGWIPACVLLQGDDPPPAAVLHDWTMQRRHFKRPNHEVCPSEALISPDGWIADLTAGAALAAASDAIDAMEVPGSPFAEEVREAFHRFALRTKWPMVPTATTAFPASTASTLPTGPGPAAQPIAPRIRPRIQPRSTTPANVRRRRPAMPRGKAQVVAGVAAILAIASCWYLLPSSDPSSDGTSGTVPNASGNAASPRLATGEIRDAGENGETADNHANDNLANGEIGSLAARGSESGSGVDSEVSEAMLSRTEPLGSPLGIDAIPSMDSLLASASPSLLGNPLSDRSTEQVVAPKFGDEPAFGQPPTFGEEAGVEHEDEAMDGEAALGAEPELDDAEPVGTLPPALEIALRDGSSRAEIRYGRGIVVSRAQCSASLDIDEEGTNQRELLVRPEASQSIDSQGSCLWSLAMEDTEAEVLLQLWSKPASRWKVAWQWGAKLDPQTPPVRFEPSQLPTLFERLTLHQRLLQQSIEGLRALPRGARRPNQPDPAAQLRWAQAQEKETQRLLRRWQEIADLCEEAMARGTLHVEFRVRPVEFAR